MTFFNSHHHLTGIVGSSLLLKSMPWAQIISAVQVSVTRKNRDVRKHTKQEACLI